MCVFDGPDEYKDKKTGNMVRSHMISCLDQCPSGVLLKNTFDYQLSEDEKGKFAGRLMGKVIELDVVELAPLFQGGRLRARGHIVAASVEGKK